MARSPGRPRQVSIADNLWESFLTMADHAGTEVDLLVNQAMFELALRLGYVTPVAVDAAPVLDDHELPGGGDAHPGKKPTVSPPRKAPPPAAPIKRPPRPSPRSQATAAAASTESKGLFIVNESGDMEKVDKDIFIIGRSSKCDLVINSVKVSREHSIITRERGEYFIEDLGSANGTWYKGEKIEKMKIKEGDEVFICDEKFKFVLK